MGKVDNYLRNEYRYGPLFFLAALFLTAFVAGTLLLEGLAKQLGSLLTYSSYGSMILVLAVLFVALSRWILSHQTAASSKNS